MMLSTRKRAADASTLQDAYFANWRGRADSAKMIKIEAVSNCSVTTSVQQTLLQTLNSALLSAQYAAPTGFAYSPPFWLLLELPEYWPAGLDDWTRVCETRLPVFLQVLEEREKMAIHRGVMTGTTPLDSYEGELGERGFLGHLCGKKELGV